MALNGLHCADVPLRNYSLTLSNSENFLPAPKYPTTCTLNIFLVLSYLSHAGVSVSNLHYYWQIRHNQLQRSNNNNSCSHTHTHTHTLFIAKIYGSTIQ